jgi:hypothetical protein
MAFAKSNTRDPRTIHYKLALLEQITLKAETDRPSRVVVARRQVVTRRNAMARVEFPVTSKTQP